MAHLRRTADFWSRLAKQQGYPARSVFKLKEIDHKFKIFRAGHRVCDLGCSPGSWSMFAAERVGPRGFVLGLDLQPLPLTIPLAAHVRILRQDVFDWQVPDEFKGSFDVLLSDMAPSTSGIKLLDANSSHELCHQALQVAQTILKPNGTLVMKIFEGGGYKSVLRAVEARFASTQSLKPEATRGESVETFIIAKKMRHPNVVAAAAAAAAAAEAAGETAPDAETNVHAHQQGPTGTSSDQPPASVAAPPQTPPIAAAKPIRSLRRTRARDVDLQRK